MKRLLAAIDAVRPHLPADKAFELTNDIDQASFDVESARWEAMWLLGVCVGVRLGGGR